MEQKTKALISCAVSAQLICAFGFAYADCWFSVGNAITLAVGASCSSVNVLLISSCVNCLLGNVVDKATEPPNLCKDK